MPTPRMNSAVSLLEALARKLSVGTCEVIVLMLFRFNCSGFVAAFMTVDGDRNGLQRLGTLVAVTVTCPIARFLSPPLAAYVGQPPARHGEAMAGTTWRKARTRRIVLLAAFTVLPREGVHRARPALLANPGTAGAVCAVLHHLQY